jgi:hypothetical protein
MNFERKRTNDNIYKPGTVMSTKGDPSRELMIMKYIHDTYYCTVVGDPESKVLRYREYDLAVLNKG